MSTLLVESDSAVQESVIDNRSYDELVDASRVRAYRMAFQLTRNASDAEDLLQDTLLKAWKGFDSYSPGRPFLNWILRIMQRAFLDLKRRDNPIRKAESLNSMVSPSDGEIQEIPVSDPGPTPEELLFHQAWTAEFHNALAELPDVYRTAIQMCDLEELSYSEIAEAQNTTIGTVRSRIHRGRRLLRDIIQKKGLQPV